MVAVCENPGIVSEVSEVPEVLHLWRRVAASILSTVNSQCLTRTKAQPPSSYLGVSLPVALEGPPRSRPPHADTSEFHAACSPYSHPNGKNREERGGDAAAFSSVQSVAQCVGPRSRSPN